MKKIEQAVFASTKKGIDSDYSGGGYYSYSKEMGLLKEKIGSRMNGYYTAIAFDKESRLEQQYISNMPHKFAYDIQDYENQQLFVMSYIKPDIDYGAMAGSERARIGSKLSHMIAGDLGFITSYPAEYIDCNIFLGMPYTEKDFTSQEKPDYMETWDEITVGSKITQNSAAEFVLQYKNGREHLKKLCYLLLRACDAQNKKKRLILCDEKENIIFWIAALMYLLPVEQAKKISFSTYEGSPETPASFFRIVGVYPKGTPYDDIDSEDPNLLIYDFMSHFSNNTFSDMEHTVYDFLVEAFLNGDHISELYKFHKYLQQYHNSETGISFEVAVFLYLVHEHKKSVRDYVGDWNLLADFAGTCTNPQLMQELMVFMLSAYREIHSAQEAAGRFIQEALLQHKIESVFVTDSLTEDIITMLLPGKNILVETIRRTQMSYVQLLQKANINFVSVLGEKIIERGKEILSNNASYGSNLYVTENILNNILVNKKDKAVLFGREQAGVMVQQAACNIMYTSQIPLSDKKAFFEKIVEKFKNDIETCLRLLDLFEENAIKFNIKDAGNYLEDIKKTCISDFTGNNIQLYDVLYKIGAFSDIMDIVLSKPASRAEFQDKVTEVVYILEHFPSLSDDMHRRQMQEMLNNSAHKIKDYSKLYNYGRLWDGEFTKAIVNTIIRKLPLVVTDQADRETVYAIERQYGSDLSNKFELICLYLRMKDLAEREEIPENYLTYLPEVPIKLSESIESAQMDAYIKAMSDVYLKIAFIEGDMAVMAMGAGIIDDEAICHSLQAREVQVILESKFGLSSLLSTSGKWDISEMLAELTVAQCSYNQVFNKHKMISQLELSSYKFVKNSSKLLDSIEDITRQYNIKRHLRAKKVDEEKVYAYWEDIVEIMRINQAEKKKSVGDLLYGLFGRKK